MPHVARWALALKWLWFVTLASGCPASTDPDPDTTDPDTTDSDTTDSDTTDPDTADPDTADPEDCPEISSTPVGSAEPIACDDPTPELVPVSFELIDPCRRCVVGGMTEHLPAADWYPWWYNAFCSEQGCLDESGYAVDTAGRCLYFNSICSVWEAPMPTGLVGQCSWGDSGLPALDPDHPCCAAAASERYLPPCPEPE